MSRAVLPELEAVALGVAVAGGGVESAALMGLSAARIHGALPYCRGQTVSSSKTWLPRIAVARRCSPRCERA